MGPHRENMKSAKYLKHNLTQKSLNYVFENIGLLPVCVQNSIISGPYFNSKRRPKEKGNGQTQYVSSEGTTNYDILKLALCASVLL